MPAIAIVLALVLGGGGIAALVRGAPLPVAVLAIAELAAAILLVLPRTRRAGAIGMVVVLAAASTLHAALGEWPPASFAVYAVALVAIARSKR